MLDHSASNLVGVSAVLLGLGAMTVVLRFYARRHQKASLLADDWLMVPALATFIGACSCIFYAVHLKAFGYSTFEISRQQREATLERSGKAQIALNLSSIVCLGSVKASALFFYKRIFCVAGRKAALNVIIITLLVIVACWVVTFEILLAFQCGTHFSAPWDGTQLKYCTMSYPVLQAQAVSDFLLDVLVLIMPMYPVTQLHTTWTRKVAIVGIFLLACIPELTVWDGRGVGAAVARMVIIIHLVNVGQSTVHKVDPERYLSRVVFYFILEMGVGLVAVNLPSIWMVFTSVAPDALLRSIRSVVSLASFRSSRSRSFRERHNPEPLKSSASFSSVVPLSSHAKASVPEAFELQPQRPLSDIPEPSPGEEIHARRVVEDKCLDGKVFSSQQDGGQV
ncbi:hypothetical protein E4U55_002036 [Claviceps digitariae]|nr:hypothetical protein E4U55_002036 [Claviceps digitariae]